MSILEGKCKLDYDYHQMRCPICKTDLHYDDYYKALFCDICNKPVIFK